MSGPIRRACDQCFGTDTQYECERGQCYAAEHYQRQEDQERNAELEREAETPEHSSSHHPRNPDNG